MVSPSPGAQPEEAIYPQPLCMDLVMGLFCMISPLLLSEPWVRFHGSEIMQEGRNLVIPES